MPYNGSGVYAAPLSPGAFNLAVDGMPATPAAWNALLADITTALSTAVLKDGTQIVTANIPMATFKFMGLGEGLATSFTDSVSVANIQKGNLLYATDASVGANTIVLTLGSGAIVSVGGPRISFEAAFANTSICTVKLNADVARALRWPNLAPMVPGDIPLGALIEIAYDPLSAFWLLQTVSVPSPAAGLIQGLTYANDIADATNDLDIATGMCMDATGAQRMVLSTALVKQTDAVWAAGTGAGCMDVAPASNNSYYIWLIARVSSSASAIVDVLCSLSSTAPTMPAGYTFKRLIGWFVYNSGITPFKTYETAGGGLRFLWPTPTLDVNLANTLTTARRTDAVRVPVNLATNALLNVTLVDAGAGFDAYIYCPDQADVAPGNSTTAPLATFRSVAAGTAAGQIEVYTSATGTIAARASLATVDQYSVSTLGFTWSRRT